MSITFIYQCSDPDVSSVSLSLTSLYFSCIQVKYREGKKELSTNLYSLLPETEEMKFAKAAMELQSEVGLNVQ